MRNIVRVMRIVLLLVPVSSCAVGTVIRIVHPETEKINNTNFESNEFSKYMIRGVVIFPIFGNHNTTSYRLNVNSITTNKNVLELIIHSYNLHCSLKNEVLIKKSNEIKLVYKSSRDRAYWGENAFSAGGLLFDNTALPVHKNSKLVLLLDVSIILKNGSERKQIKYKLEIKEEKYFINFSQ